MEPTKPASAGYLSSLRLLADGFLGLAEDRLRLFTLELQEEKYRLIQTFLWISAVVFTAMLAIIFASLVLVYLFWDTARLAVLCGLALFYLASTVLIVVAFRRYLTRQPNPFDATLQEIGEDRSCIRPPN